MKSIRTISLALVSAFGTNSSQATPFQLIDIHSKFDTNVPFLKIKKDALSGYIAEDTATYKRKSLPADMVNQELIVLPISDYTNSPLYPVIAHFENTNPELVNVVLNHLVSQGVQDPRDPGFASILQLLNTLNAHDFPQFSNISPMLEALITDHLAGNYTSVSDVFAILQSLANHLECLHVLSQMTENSVSQFLTMAIETPDLIKMLYTITLHSESSATALAPDLQLMLSACPNLLVIITGFGHLENWLDAFKALSIRLSSISDDNGNLLQQIVESGFQAQLWLFIPIAKILGLNITSQSHSHPYLMDALHEYFTHIHYGAGVTGFNDPDLPDTFATLIVQHPELLMLMQGVQSSKRQRVTKDELNKFATLVEKVVLTGFFSRNRNPIISNLYFFYSNPDSLHLLQHIYHTNQNPLHLRTFFVSGIETLYAYIQNPQNLGNAITGLLIAMTHHSISENENWDEFTTQLASILLDYYSNNHQQHCITGLDVRAEDGIKRGGIYHLAKILIKHFNLKSDKYKNKDDLTECLTILFRRNVLSISVLIPEPEPEPEPEIDPEVLEAIQKRFQELKRQYRENMENTRKDKEESD